MPLNDLPPLGEWSPGTGVQGGVRGVSLNVPFRAPLRLPLRLPLRAPLGICPPWGRVGKGGNRVGRTNETDPLFHENLQRFLNVFWENPRAFLEFFFRKNSDC